MANDMEIDIYFCIKHRWLLRLILLSHMVFRTPLFVPGICLEVKIDD